MKFINGWKYVQKDANRVEYRLRIGLLTVFDLFLDFSDRKVRATLLNFTVEN
jgi:hypothetical protein